MKISSHHNISCLIDDMEKTTRDELKRRAGTEKHGYRMAAPAVHDAVMEHRKIYDYRALTLEDMCDPGYVAVIRDKLCVSFFRVDLEGGGVDNITDSAITDSFDLTTPLALAILRLIEVKECELAIRIKAIQKINKLYSID